MLLIARKWLRRIAIGVAILLFVLWVIARILGATNDVRHSGFEIDVYGETIHYLDSADLNINADGTPILLLHGSSGNLWDMEYRLAGELQKVGFRTISLDRPGLGSSSRNDPALADPRLQAALFDGFLEALKVDQAVVLGHSLGNASLMGMALNYSDRMIAGVNVAGVTHAWLGEPWEWYQWTEVPVWGFIWTEIILPIVGPVILPGMAAETFAPDPMPENFIYDGGVNHIMQPFAFRSNAADNMRLRYYMIDMFTDYDKIDTPMLLMWGEGEYALSPEQQETMTGVAVPYWNHAGRLEGLLPDTETVVTPGVGHMMQHFGGESIATNLVRFLDERGLR